MSIQAVKGVEIGDGFDVAGRRGSEAHDAIRLRRGRRATGGRPTGPAASRAASPPASWSWPGWP